MLRLVLGLALLASCAGSATQVGDSGSPDLLPATTPDTREASPDTRPASPPDVRPATTPDTRPATTPDTRPATTPDTRPASSPDVLPVDTRPATTPDTRACPANDAGWSCARDCFRCSASTGILAATLPLCASADITPAHATDCIAWADVATCREWSAVEADACCRQARALLGSPCKLSTDK